ncbi:MAG: DUF4465 domain-containing protein [Bacteroidales bacterium]|nr:DUF4465 domain-containing protein [Bacteroidales bacterium]
MKNIYATLVLTSLLAGGLTAQVKTGTETSTKTSTNTSTKTGAISIAAKNSAAIAASLRQGLPPERTTPIPNHEATEDAPNRTINLSTHFTDPNDPPAALTFEVLHNSVPGVASVTIDDQQMHIDYLSAGQTNIIIKASLNDLFTTDTFIAGVRPVIDQDAATATFDDLSLDSESFWNGSDGTGNFTSGTLVFYNEFNADWQSWFSWAYSSITDNTTPGYGNQYSAISAVRLDYASGKNYGVTYTSPFSQVNTTLDCDQVFPGFFVTNSTYAALSMKYGDSFSKKFGGADGSDPDWLKLTIRGNRNDGTFDTVSFYLADYRTADPADDYIIETWQWVDLTPLGKVHSLSFTLSSTDNGNWGMNTPAYFCMDNLYVIPDLPPEILNPIADHSGEPGQTFAFALTELFTDPDDDDARFTYALEQNSWDSLVIHPYIDGDTLRVELRAEGTSNLGVSGISNTKPVFHAFNINVQLTGFGQDDADRFTLYPNPSTGVFTLASGSTGPMEVTILDISGRTVYRNSRFTPGGTIDLGNQPRGTYLAKIRSDRTTHTEKIILE